MINLTGNCELAPAARVFYHGFLKRDIHAKVRPEGVGKESEFSALCRGLKDIHVFAQTFGLSVLVIHHNRKGGNSLDPFEDVAGSLAFTSLPDATLILRRDGTGTADGILYGLA